MKEGMSEVCVCVCVILFPHAVQRRKLFRTVMSKKSRLLSVTISSPVN